MASYDTPEIEFGTASSLWPYFAKHFDVQRMRHALRTTSDYFSFAVTDFVQHGSGNDVRDLRTALEQVASSQFVTPGEEAEDGAKKEKRDQHFEWDYGMLIAEAVSSTYFSPKDLGSHFYFGLSGSEMTLE